VFDLGTGGAQLLRTRSGAWLFDTGTERDFRLIIEPALRAAGVGRPDVLVLTHGDGGHISGAIPEAAGARRVIVPAFTGRSPAERKIREGLRAAGFPKTIALAGDTFRAGSAASVEILAPSAAARIADDQALVVRIRTPGFRVLLMSDSGAAAEDALLHGGAEALRSDILVLGRHGSDITATAGFLDAVRPRVIVLAPADAFRDGSDEPALRERLAHTGARVFDQAVCGAVVITFGDGSARVRGFLDGEESVLAAE
jgi:competence protein ComEC